MRQLLWGPLDSPQKHGKNNQNREGWGPLGPPGSPLSVLVGFSMFFVDFLMIFKVFGKKTKKFSSSFGFCYQVFWFLYVYGSCWALKLFF